jgi:hypothetical protein
LNGLVRGGYYYLRDENAATEYTYDRALDPEQLDNLAGREGPGEVAEFLVHNREMMAALKKKAEARAFARDYVRLDAAAEENLRALGYIN